MWNSLRSLMPRAVLGCSALFIAVLAGAVPPTTPAPVDPAAKRSISDTIVESGNRAVALNDETFGRAAALSNLSESELSRIALEQTRNLRVKLLANQMLKDRTSIEMALQEVARKKKLELPDRLRVEQQAAVSELKLKPREQFDTAYVLQMREKNVRAIALFEQARSSEALSREMRDLAGMGLKILLASQQKTLAVEVPVKPAKLTAGPA